MSTNPAPVLVKIKKVSKFTTLAAMKNKTLKRIDAESLPDRSHRKATSKSRVREE